MSVPQPFNPHEFAQLAVELAESTTNESRLRTAVSRIYYAVLWVARERTGTRARARIHEETYRALRHVEGWRATSEQLNKLRRLRNAADYEPVPDNPLERNWQYNWTTAHNLAEAILRRLELTR